MYVYFRGYKNGYHELQAFHKPDAAIEYVINQIEAIIGSGVSNIPKKRALKKPRAAQVGIDVGPLNPYFQAEMPAPPAYNIDVAQPAYPNPYPEERRANVYGDQVFDRLRELTTSLGKVSHKKTTVNTPQPKELKKLLDQIAIAKKSKTLENAIEAINLFEAYNVAVLGDESAIHTLQDIKVVQ